MQRVHGGSALDERDALTRVEEPRVELCRLIDVLEDGPLLGVDRRDPLGLGGGAQATEVVLLVEVLALLQGDGVGSALELRLEDHVSLVGREHAGRGANGLAHQERRLGSEDGVAIGVTHRAGLDGLIAHQIGGAHLKSCLDPGCVEAPERRGECPR